ncbi:MAG: hypothetical protein AAF485_00125 [Chloroflexota bacterium]
MKRQIYTILILIFITTLACGLGGGDSDAPAPADNSETVAEAEATTEPTEEAPTSTPMPEPTATPAPTETPTDEPTTEPESNTSDTVDLQTTASEPVPPFPETLDQAAAGFGQGLYTQAFPEAWSHQVGASVYDLDINILYAMVASTDELKAANKERIDNRDESPAYLPHVSLSQGETDVDINGGAVLFSSMLPTRLLELTDSDPLAILNELIEANQGELTLMSSPTALTIQESPAATVIRTGTSQDGTPMTLVTTVIANEISFYDEPFVIYVTGYTDASLEAEMMPMLGWMTNQVTLVQDYEEAVTVAAEPTSEATAEPTSEPTAEPTSETEAAATTEPAVSTESGERITTQADTFSISHPADWVNDISGAQGFALFASNQTLLDDFASTFEDEASFSEGAAVWVIAFEKELLGIPGDPSPLEVLSLFGDIGNEENITVDVAAEEIVINGYPAAKLLATAIQPDGSSAGIIATAIVGKTHVAWVNGFVIDPTLRSVVEESIESFELTGGP